VSGVSGPAGPVSGGFGPPPSGGPPPTRRGSRLPLVLSIVAVVLVVLVAGTVGVALMIGNRDDGDPTTPTGAGTPAKYDATKLPQNLCESIDLGPLASRFDAQVAQPTANRQLNTSVSMITCTISRQQATAAVLSVLFMVSVYTDPKLAVDQQRLGLENAKLNDPTTRTLDGVGEEAFATRTSGSQTASTVGLTLEMRDANLRWSAYLTASSLTGAGWTDDERARFVTDLGAVVKASHARYAGG
jgi:hypothetical protein